MLKKKNILFFILSVFLSIIVVFSSVSPIQVSADSSILEIEKTNVLDDLKDMTIDGKKFSLEDYNFDTKKDTQILSFVEYCYSPYEEKQDNFGFYVYIYNPKGLNFDTTSLLNTIQFSTTKNTDSSYKKYKLKFLNMSEETDYKGLFYKFKVVLSDNQKTAILNSINSFNRVYNVSGFELLIQGDRNTTDYVFGYTFKYSGFAKGYGPGENAESTLKFTSEELETLSLDVHSTTYRPDGTNGKNDYTQDSLHSVYFAVPNDIIKKYGEMVAVHATWLNAVIKPALVTGNQSAFDELCAYMGIPLDSSCDYAYIGAYEALFYNGDFAGHIGELAYVPDSFNLIYNETYSSYLDCLYMLFFSGNEVDSADNYIVSPNEILAKLDYTYNMFGGGLVNGKYPEVMFESFDESFTEVTINSDDTFDLKNLVINKTYWEKFLGLSGTVLNSGFDGIQAIYPINSTDILGTPEEVSERLYISESDVDDFKEYYIKNNVDSTIYLFRYQVSDYFSQEATCFHYGEVFSNTWGDVDTNAYFFQETVNLDFDIIDVTFSTGEVETVIPVVSNPIDVIGEGSPPIYTTPEEGDNQPFDLLKLIVGLLLLFLLLWFFSAIGVLPLIGKILIWLITAPFKFIKWLIDKFRGD